MMILPAWTYSRLKSSSSKYVHIIIQMPFTFQLLTYHAMIEMKR